MGGCIGTTTNKQRGEEIGAGTGEVRREGDGRLCSSSGGSCGQPQLRTGRGKWLVGALASASKVECRQAQHAAGWAPGHSQLACRSRLSRTMESNTAAAGQRAPTSAAAATAVREMQLLGCAGSCCAVQAVSGCGVSSCLELLQGAIVQLQRGGSGGRSGK